MALIDRLVINKHGGWTLRLTTTEWHKLARQLPISARGRHCTFQIGPILIEPQDLSEIQIQQRDDSLALIAQLLKQE